MRKDVKKLLNLNFTDTYNATYHIGPYDMPYIECSIHDYPDYLALYSEPGLYTYTPNTAVCFYEYDYVFDGYHGLYNAIYYDDKKLIKFYKQRFQGVRYIISPDYSQCKDVPVIENLYRHFKTRIISVWLAMELDIVVIPSITYSDISDFKNMIFGMERCRVVACSTKGVLNNRTSYQYFKSAIKYTMDHLSLDAIILYSSTPNIDSLCWLRQYAYSKHVQVIIPHNTLMCRNADLQKRSILNG